MEAVLVENVSKSFGDVQAVYGLSVQVPVGSIYGFLGPNGAGKTTTIRMIMDIIRPDTGRIAIFRDGETARSKNIIGYMPEERGLYRKMSVGKVLAYFGSLKGVSKNNLAEKVSQWLSRVGLNDWADKKVEELSRGMHQKLQFAVTAINDPDLLILDEPFSGLDPVNLDLLKSIILDLRSRGTTVVFSTHVMHEAERLCDYILLINKGHVVVDGKLEQIRSQYMSNSVVVELQGDAGFIEKLPITTKVESQGPRLEITLAADVEPQQLLKELVDRVTIRAFEVKTASLHEIFVQMVGSDDA
ncbi:MAG: ABC transporter ATP-binding protein [Planctomycetota bacterium]|jgi:ABC-2 type transport system ATP-binding protein